VVKHPESVDGRLDTILKAVLETGGTEALTTIRAIDDGVLGVAFGTYGGGQFIILHA
jgi:hypothetical protein